MGSFFIQILNVALALFASAVYVFRRSARRAEPSGRSRILVVQPAKMGDMVCATPLFTAIKKQYPDATLLVAGNALNRELLLGNPHIDEYIVLGPTSQNRRMFEEKNIDFACVTAPDFRVLAAFMLARIPQIAVPRVVGGHSPYVTRTYRYLCQFVSTAPHHIGSYAPREYLRLLEPLGIVSEDTRKELWVQKNAVGRVEEMLKQRGCDSKIDFLVGIAPSAGVTKIKAWGAERFAKVAQYVGERHHATIVIIAGKGEKEDVGAMLDALQAGMNVLDFSGMLSIEELKALISLLKLFVSSDTGPVHIAEALRVPTVDVLGAVDEHETFLSGPLTRAVFAPARGRPELHVMSAASYRPAEVRRQTDLVTVEMVIAAVEDLLAAIKKPRTNPWHT